MRYGSASVPCPSHAHAVSVVSSIKSSVIAAQLSSLLIIIFVVIVFVI